jgi:glycine hydroxymethyltransferase
MAGPLNLTIGDAGFGGYIKLYKPFFVGREAFIRREGWRKAAIVPFPRS